MSAWSRHKTGECVADTCYYCKTAEPESLKQGWNGKCHACEELIREVYVAQIGQYWICNSCLAEHFPEKEYSVNQAADILERVRGFR